MIRSLPTIRIPNHPLLPWVAALITGCLTAVGVFYVDHLEQRRLQQELRSETLEKLSHIRAEIEGHLNSDLQLFNGLVAQISLHPDISDAELESFSHALMKKSSIVRSMGVSEKYIIRHVYPLAGNEKAIGMNYLDNAAQREPVLRAVNNQQTVLAGPVTLAQGGQALIGRLPIFNEQIPGNTFWGLVAVVIDINLLFEKSGLLEDNPGMNIAIRGRDGLGAQGETFFGEQSVFENDPIFLDVTLPGGQWRLGAEIQDTGDHANLHITLHVMGAMLVFVISLATLVMMRELQQQKKIIAVEAESKEQIWYAATHDRLTDMANRFLFNEELQRYIAQARRNQTSLAVLYCDLDGFKNINDSFGHQVGDLFLKELANRMSQQIRETELIARLGGDEFAILDSNLKSLDDAAMLAQRLVDIINQPVDIGRSKLHGGVSIGIAIFPNDGETPSELLHSADLAMYKAKQDVKCHYAFFEESMNLEVQTHKLLVEDIRQGLELSQFSLVYQPIVNLSTGRVTGIETLARWNHPQRGTVSPGIFIPAAEKSGLILSVGEWIIENACAEVFQQLNQLNPTVELSINFSAIQIHRGNLAELVQSILDQYQLPARTLDIEITESAILEDVDKATEVVNTLREAGISITIDDFGTGYSSLSHLRYLPVNRIKLDLSFVRGIGIDAQSEAIVKSILYLADSLNIRVTAEGVETAEQLEFLQQHGCSEIQGYYFSKPLDQSAIFEFIDNFEHPKFACA